MRSRQRKGESGLSLAGPIEARPTGVLSQNSGDLSQDGGDLSQDSGDLS